MKVIKYIRKEYKDIKKVLFKRTTVFNRKKILHKKYRKISFIVIALLVIVNMTIFSFNAFSQMGVQEANSLESYAVVAYTEPGSHTWTVPNGVSSVDVLVVAGGGGGGGHRGGGGGAGELVFESNYLVSSGESILIEVGDGGSGGANSYGSNGEQSKFGTITAVGGGGGAPHGSIGNNGGSGGGGGCDNNNGGSSTATSGSGNSGGYGPPNWGNTGSAGGGGGAGSVGLTPQGASGYIDYPGNGGDGMYFGDVFGERYGENGWFAGGGGGGTEGHSGATNNSPYDRPIGMAGGGDGGMIEYIDPVDSGSSYNQHSGTDAVDGTGSGGGGGNYRNTVTSYGGDGGSGVVLVKYKVNLGTLQGSTLNKGLVGHWSMDEDEYIEGTENLVDIYDWGGHGSSWVNTGDYYRGREVFKNTVTNPDVGNNYGFRVVNKNISINDYKLTISFYAKLLGDSGGMSGYARVYYTDGTYGNYGWNYNPNIFNNFSTYQNKWTYVTATVSLNTSKTPDYISHIYVYKDFVPAGAEMDICCIQVENKDHATPFINGIRYGRLTDKTPYSNHGDTGTQQSFAFSEDRFGNSGGAMSFDGISDYISMGDIDALDSGDLTISTWAKINNTGVLIGKHYNNFELRLEGTYFGGYIGDSYGWTEINDGAVVHEAALSEWNHYTWLLSYSTDIIYFYTNGEYKGSFLVPEGMSHHTVSDALIFGRRNPGANAYFKGALDDVRIYNRILSESEIQSLYNSYEPKISAGSLNKGLVLDMPLTLKYTKNETAGSEIMTDKTPYSNDGQNYGATISADGGSFDGNDYIGDIDTNNPSLLEPSSITVSSWINLDINASTNRHIWFTKWLGYSNEIEATTRLPYLRLNGPGDIKSNTPITPGQWQHFVGTYDPSIGGRVYLDGELVGTRAANGNIGHSRTYPLNIGRYYGGIYFDGKISNAKIYNRALSGTEVKSLYDKGRNSGSGITIKPYGSVSGMAGLSCLDILNNNPSAINNDGVYWINPEGDNPFQVYCDMTTDGGGWTLLLYHDSSTGSFFGNETNALEYNKSFPGFDNYLYSIVGDMNNIASSLPYEFLIEYPNNNIKNHWKQTFDPLSGGSPVRPTEGYEAISIGWSGNYWGGLEKDASSTLLDGSVNHSNWYYAIGSYGSWGSSTTFPGGNGTAVSKVKFFIR